MTNRRQLIPLAGLAVTMAVVAYMVIQLGAQAATIAGDFSNAAVAEVRDSQGQVVLRGQFVVEDEDDDDVERKAELKPTGVDADAAGEAEVEFDTDRPATTQEIEFTVRNVQPGAVFTFVIDGQDVASGTANDRGMVEVELAAKRAAAAASR